MTVKIIFINILKTQAFISSVTESDQLINKKIYFTDISDFSSQLKKKRKKKRKKKTDKVNLSILSIDACLKKEDFADW